ncbi:unnamed protein product, partial [Mesorhabditis belari]|uniref:Uncharacterized protein n=1 Tax=Mesorhabditis belari TaxID=2138241 RepID=A0AAF3J6W9_9BILA
MLLLRVNSIKVESKNTYELLLFDSAKRLPDIPGDGSTFSSSTKIKLRVPKGILVIVVDLIQFCIFPMSDSANTPSPSNVQSTTNVCVSTTATSRPTSSTSKPPIPTSLSEWQLLAVLQRANLVQYYDTFISQGGDDINQIMQCDESEFLEIMSLVGMLSKPLHVRRLQRTLTDFSKDPAAFNLSAIPLIGPPPISNFPTGANPIDFLLPGIASLQQSPSPSLFHPETTTPLTTTTSVAHSTSTISKISTVPITAIDFTNPLSAIGATAANVLSQEYLQSLVASAAAATQQMSRQNEHNITTANSKDPNSIRITKSGLPSSSNSPHISSTDDFVALGDFDPNAPQTETPSLSEAQIRRLNQCATLVVQNLPKLAPKLVQNKKRISQEILDLMALPLTSPQRADEYRKFSAIYGRFDAKRKPDKILTLHEVSVNEAAAQLCMLQPVLLTRRDELFPLSRQVVKDAGYHYTKSRERRRKEDADGEERSTPSMSPSPSMGDDDEHYGSEEKRRKIESIGKDVSHEVSSRKL